MKKLKRNDQVIDFSSKDYQGHTINLVDYKGKKILLSFFRNASCPFCNLRVKQLINKHAEFLKNGIQIIVFFAAVKEDIYRYAGNQNVPFPIIPDPNLEIYKKYGIKQSSAGMIKKMLKPLKMMKVMTSGFFNLKSIKEKPLIPADFLIDEKQSVYRAFYGNDFGDHLPIAEVLNWKE